MDPWVSELSAYMPDGRFIKSQKPPRFENDIYSLELELMIDADSNRLDFDPGKLREIIGMNFAAEYMGISDIGFINKGKLYEIYVPGLKFSFQASYHIMGWNHHVVLNVSSTDPNAVFAAAQAARNYSRHIKNQQLEPAVAGRYGLPQKR
ncbi:MAG: hypothetical protein NDI94_01055 [Candidatus Woesearchaeota archaeon]|nr:hypothetical protein [Candidatus Woesearchaeota archaeon]